MLDLKHILASARMMQQTGSNYPSYHTDHINPSEHLDIPPALTDKKTVAVNLDYNENGDIVQK